MSVFKTENNVPDVYVNASRDFQLLGRLLDLNVNDTKFNIEGIIRSLNVKTCPSRLLPLIQTNLGFFTEKSFSDEVLRQILSAFPYIMKYKGSKKGIYEAIYLYLRASRLKSKFSVQITNDDLDHSIVISFYDTPSDTTVLEEVLKYIVPTGYSIRYVFTKQFDTDALKQPLKYHRDYLEGVIVGNAIDNQLRSTSFDNDYVQGNKVFNDLLSGVDTAVTGQLKDYVIYPDDKDTEPTSIPKPIVQNGIIQNSWQQLSWISMSSKDESRFDGLSVGDKKLIHLSSGIIGNDTLGKIEIPEQGLDLYAEIIDFDHNSDLEGYGITFQIKDVNNSPICFVQSETTGIKLKNESTNTGGWQYSELRSEFLGSVKKQGLKDATTDTAIEPLNNTLMSRLPYDLRKVMKPIIKYSDNLNEDHTQSSFNTTVTPTTDYLPILSQSEVSSSTTGINSTESDYCKKYDIFTNNEDRKKYKNFGDNTSSELSRWWLRSTKYLSQQGVITYDRFFACVQNTGAIGTNSPNVFSQTNAQGVAPIFLV